eukprot:27989_1
MSRELDEYSVLSDTAEHMISINFFVLTPISIGISFAILFVLPREIKAIQNDENIYPKYTMQCAFVAALSTVLGGLTQLLFCNDLIIGWDYASSHSFATATESVIFLFYSVVKLSFYFGFTFHFQSIVYSWSTRHLSFGFKLLMVLVALYSVGSAVVVIVDDAAVYAKKEIGVTLKHNIYLTVVTSHTENTHNIVQFVALGFIVVDLLYFGILLFLYVSKLRAMDNNSREKGVKALVLVVISCVLFWVFMVTNAFNIPFKYVAGSLDGMAACICLFAVCDSGQVIYDNVCGCVCHTCMGKVCYGCDYKSSNDPAYHDPYDDVSDVESSEII